MSEHAPAGPDHLLPSLLKGSIQAEEMDRGNGAAPGAGASRAERFEDEKRRIIETCFNKKDPDGSRTPNNPPPPPLPGKRKPVCSLPPS